MSPHVHTGRDNLRSPARCRWRVDELVERTVREVAGELGKEVAGLVLGVGPVKELDL